MKLLISELKQIAEAFGLMLFFIGLIITACFISVYHKYLKWRGIIK